MLKLALFLFLTNKRNNIIIPSASKYRSGAKWSCTKLVTLPEPAHATQGIQTFPGRSEWHETQRGYLRQDPGG